MLNYKKYGVLAIMVCITAFMAIQINKANAKTCLIGRDGTEDCADDVYVRDSTICPAGGSVEITSCGTGYKKVFTGKASAPSGSSRLSRRSCYRCDKIISSCTGYNLNESQILGYNEHCYIVDGPCYKTSTAEPLYKVDSKSTPDEGYELVGNTCQCIEQNGKKDDGNGNCVNCVFTATSPYTTVVEADDPIVHDMNCHTCHKLECGGITKYECMVETHGDYKWDSTDGCQPISDECNDVAIKTRYIDATYDIKDPTSYAAYFGCGSASSIIRNIDVGCVINGNNVTCSYIVASGSSGAGSVAEYNNNGGVISRGTNGCFINSGCSEWINSGYIYEVQYQGKEFCCDATGISDLPQPSSSSALSTTAVQSATKYYGTLPTLSSCKTSAGLIDSTSNPNWVFPAQYFCESGDTLNGAQCLSCPENYSLNSDNKCVANSKSCQKGSEVADGVCMEFYCPSDYNYTPDTTTYTCKCPVSEPEPETETKTCQEQGAEYGLLMCEEGNSTCYNKYETQVGHTLSWANTDSHNPGKVLYGTNNKICDYALTCEDVGYYSGKTYCALSDLNSHTGCWAEYEDLNTEISSGSYNWSSTDVYAADGQCIDIHLICDGYIDKYVTEDYNETQYNEIKKYVTFDRYVLPCYNYDTCQDDSNYIKIRPKVLGDYGYSEYYNVDNNPTCRMISLSVSIYMSNDYDSDTGNFTTYYGYSESTYPDAIKEYMSDVSYQINAPTMVSATDGYKSGCSGSWSGPSGGTFQGNKLTNSYTSEYESAFCSTSLDIYKAGSKIDTVGEGDCDILNTNEGVPFEVCFDASD